MQIESNRYGTRSGLSRNKLPKEAIHLKNGLSGQFALFVSETFNLASCMDGHGLVCSAAVDSVARTQLMRGASPGSPRRVLPVPQKGHWMVNPTPVPGIVGQWT